MATAALQDVGETQPKRAIGDVEPRTEIGDAVPREASIVSAARQRFTCPRCGHVLRVSGRDRHRIYFELDDEHLSNPVMDGRCPECGRGLHDKTP